MSITAGRRPEPGSLFGNAEARAERCVDDGLADLTDVDLLAEAGRNEAAVWAGECRRLCVAAAWVQRHGVNDLALSLDGNLVPGGDRLIDLGGGGTPRVAEFALAELGTVLALSPGAVRCLVADVLDLAYRLPACWALVRAGVVPASYLRRVAAQSRQLPLEAVGSVDQTMANMIDRSTRLGQRRQPGTIGRVPWGRFLAKLDAAVMNADPEQAQADVDAEAESTGVFPTRDVRRGHRGVFIKAAAPAVAAFVAATERIADCLRVLGDQTTMPQRQAAAIGILADPTVALTVIQQAAAVDDGTTGVSDAARVVSEQRRATRDLVLYVHLTDQTLTRRRSDRNPFGSKPGTTSVARVEDIGALLADQVREWAAHTRVIVKPVIDLNHEVSVDAYETPDRLRERLILRTPADPFPYAANVSRTGDIDHTNRYVFDRGDGRPPPGQTRDSNLSRMIRSTHRLKTHSGWRVIQARNGVFFWTSPHGYQYLVDHTGTTPLGRCDRALDEPRIRYLPGSTEPQASLRLPSICSRVPDSQPSRSTTVGNSSASSNTPAAATLGVDVLGATRSEHLLEHGSQPFLGLIRTLALGVRALVDS